VLSELLEQGISARALRYFYLSVHYRQKLNYTADAAEGAEAALRRIDQMRFRLDHAVESGPGNADLAAGAERLRAEFRAGLMDDLNLSEALAALFRFVKLVNVEIESLRVGEGDKERVYDVLDEVDQVLGVLDPAHWQDAAAAPVGASDAEIDDWVRQRKEARTARDFAEADRLRDLLESHGIVIEDTAHGTRWKRG
jgi:cysteinyl-tRNA synthetase